MNKLIVSSSPHIRRRRSTKNVMLDVLIALTPAIIMSVVYFHVGAVVVLLTSVLSCVAMEFIYLKLVKKPNTANDLSAAVTGVLLAFSLPPTIPFWMVIIGSFVSVIVVKQFFGGLGRNFANPAIVGRIALMLSFGASMSRYPNAIDGVGGATPLAGGFEPTYLEMFLGLMPGSIGEVCKVALLLGGAYLVIRKVITLTIPVSFIAAVAVFALIFGENPLYHLLTGGALLAAIFMATDYVTSPTNESGKAIYGVLCGFITILIRVYGSYPEGASFAILLMNILTPYIDRATRTKPLGGVVNE